MSMNRMAAENQSRTEEQTTSISVKDAVHKLQLCLLEGGGIYGETHLFAAGSLMSKSDYQDVVTERSIAGICGYPLCPNPLPDQKPRKGRYKISLKEHKVYDLQETYMYCCASCVVESRTFAETLEDQRSSVPPNSAKIQRVLSLFDEGFESVGDLGLSKLKIQEKDCESGNVNVELIGSSDAIEGYVPRTRNPTPKKQKQPSRNRKQGSSSNNSKLKTQEEIEIGFGDMDFTSCIITQDDGYVVSKTQSSETNDVVTSNSLKASEKRVSQTGKMKKDRFNTLVASGTASIEEFNDETDMIEAYNKLSISETSPGQCQSGIEKNVVGGENASESRKVGQCSSALLKPSLKSSGAAKVNRSVTWADESAGNGNLCEFSEAKARKEAPKGARKEDPKGVRDMHIRDADALRFASAQACAEALSEAAEAVASGEYDVLDAVSEAGITVLPPSCDVDEEESDDETDEFIDTKPATVKWPKKSVVSESDFFYSEDSWFDSPPEGFSLTLSPFATMFTAIFGWISSSSLAYIYGHDDSYHEEYSSINGREYPRKVVAIDGRSSEIRRTLEGCLSRAFPELVSDINLPIPLSRLEHGLGCLLETMSFLDPLPPLKSKQWQLVVLLFLEALSVCRIPALGSYMTDRRALFQKVFDGAQISAEEYEIMKDLVIPLGRMPQFSNQSGA